jgi:hypothetical protein
MTEDYKSILEELDEESLENNEPATVSPERPTAENKETQPTRVLYIDLYPTGHSSE